MVLLQTVEKVYTDVKKRDGFKMKSFRFFAF